MRLRRGLRLLRVDIDVDDSCPKGIVNESIMAVENSGIG